MKLEKDEYCPCCGYSTLKSRERLEYAICQICYWEDDPFQYAEPYCNGGANRVSLVQGRQNFKSYGACELGMKKHTRIPTKGDKKKEYAENYTYQNVVIPFWYQLLRQYLKSPMKSGLTIPFLYGIQNEVIAEEITFNIFLKRLLNYKAPETLTIQKCGQIGEYVIGIDEDDYYNTLTKVYRIGEIIILDNSWKVIEQSQWISLMSNLYSKPIGNKKYSIKHGKWYDFNEIDKELINSTNQSIF